MDFHDVKMLHFFHGNPWAFSVINGFDWMNLHGFPLKKLPFSSRAGGLDVFGVLLWAGVGLMYLTKGFINQSVSAGNTIWVLVLTNHVAYVPQRNFRTFYWNPHQHLFRKRYVINEIRLLQCKGSLWKPHIHYSYQRKYVSFLNYHIQEIVLFP